MPRYPERLHHLERLLHQGHEPSLDDICRHLSITSKRHARRLLQQLRDEGHPVRHRQDGRIKRFFIPPERRQALTHDVPFDEEEMLALAGDRVYTVWLRVQADRAPYFERKKYHPSQRTKPLEDEQLEVSYEVAGLDEVRSFVQSWGAGVTVLAPPELVAMIASEAQEVAKRYTDGEDV